MDIQANRISLSTYKDKFNIIIVGDPSVGKTLLLEKYTNYNPSHSRKKDNSMRYQSKHSPLLEKSNTKDQIEFYTKEFTYKDNLFLFKIWDTISNDKYHKISKPLYNKADCIIIVSSINNRESFINISKWIKDISDSVKNKIMISLISNKVDLEEERNVGLDEIRQKAEEFNADYYETSAITGSGVDKAFDNILKNVINSVYKYENIENLDVEDNDKNNDIIEKNDDSSSQSLAKCAIY